VIIRRDIAIGVLDLDTAAVARVPPAWMMVPLPAAKIGVPIGAAHRHRYAGANSRGSGGTLTEARGKSAPDNRHANQEFAGRAAVLIVIIDETVIRRLKR